jgi:DNA-directed RNA polymerase specialized sigma24 family protein
MHKSHLGCTNEDFQQEAELRAIGRKFESENHRSRWASRVRRNLLIDLIRKEKRRQRILKREQSLLTRDRNLVSQAERVHNVINQMPEELAVILRMKIEKASDKEIASVIWNDSSDAARVRLRRLREQRAYAVFRELWDDQA